MSSALANFVFQAANFLVLAAALGWILFKPVRRALDAESKRHADEEAQAKRMRAEAESMAREALSARQAARRESEAQRAEILATAEAEANRILEEATYAQARMRQTFEQDLEAERNSQAVALAEMVGCIAGASVRRLLEELDGPSLDATLVRAACTELKALPGAGHNSVVVESARPLDSESRTLLESVLGKAFTERIVGDLGAGVRVTTSAGQIDATAVALARRAARAVSALGEATKSAEAEHG